MTFQSILIKCGIYIKDHVTIERENIVTKNLLEKEFESNLNVNDFIFDFNNSISDQELLEKLLAPMKNSSTAPANKLFVRSSNESLIRLILGIDKVQPKLVESLLETAIEYSDSTEKNGIFNLIIDQFRWLDYVVRPNLLSEKFIEILQVVPENLQKSMLGSLPDIICDSEHNYVAKELVSFIDESPKLLLPVLDALGCIKAYDEVERSVQKKVLRALPSSNPCDLPAIISYLCQSTINLSDTSFQVIYNIREAISSIAVSTRDEISEKSLQLLPNDSKSTKILIFESIKKGLSTESNLRKSWLTIINEDTLYKSMKPSAAEVLDLFVIFVLLGIKSMKKKAEMTFQQVSKLYQLRNTDKQLFSSEVLHPDAIPIIFEQVIDFSTQLIMAPQNSSFVGVNIMRCLIERSFKHCGDFEGQEVINLITGFIGSGVPKSVQIGTQILLSLAQKQPKKLKLYVPFVKSLLDFIIFLSLDNSRRIFDTLAIMTLLADSNSLSDELHIYIRKQLASTQPTYNTAGIVGAISMLKILGTDDSAIDTSPSKIAGPSISSKLENTKKFGDFVSILQMIMDAGKHRSWEFLSMAYDELATLVASTDLHPQLQSWLSENIANSFAEAFLSNISDLESDHDIFPLSRVVALYFDKESALVLDIYGLLLGVNQGQIFESLVQTNQGNNTSQKNHISGTRNHSSLAGNVACCLFPLFRLMQVCEKIGNMGSLSEIDAVLGCGLILPSVANLDNSSIAFNQALEPEYIDQLDSLPSSSAMIICSSLFMVSNWFRELIRAFCDQESDDFRLKSLQRVNELAVVEDYVGIISNKIEFDPKVLGLTTPTSCVSSVYTSHSHQENSSLTPNLQRIKPAFENKSKSGAGVKSGNVFSAGKRRISGGAAGNRDTWQLYRREMSINVFEFIWRSDLTLEPCPASSNIHNKAITLSGLELLLRELMLLVYSPHMQQALPNTDEIKKWVENILNGISGHLYFLLKSNDVLSDTGNSDIKKQALIKLILQLLLAFTGQTNPQGAACFYSNPRLVVKALLIHSKTMDVSRVESSSTSTISIMAFDCVYGFVKVVYPNNIAIELVKLLKCILSISRYHGNETNSENTASKGSVLSAEKKLGKVCKHLLQCEDSDFKTSDLDFLLELYIDYDESQPHVVLDDLVNFTIHEYLQLDESSRHYFPTLNNKTISIFFKSIMTGLARQFVRLGSRESEIVIGKLSHLCKVLHSIMLEARALSNYKDVLLISLRQGLLIVDTISKKIIPCLEPIFLVYKDEIIQALFHLQKSTRTMQIICGYSKVVKDLKITKLVPTVRRSLEAILFRVKALLKYNNCIAAFEIGSLRHRDLNGEIVGSQLPKSNFTKPKPKKRSREQSQESQSEELESDCGIDIEISE